MSSLIVVSILSVIIISSIIMAIIIFTIIKEYFKLSMILIILFSIIITVLCMVCFYS